MSYIHLDARREAERRIDAECRTEFPYYVKKDGDNLFRYRVIGPVLQEGLYLSQRDAEANKDRLNLCHQMATSAERLRNYDKEAEKDKLIEGLRKVGDNLAQAWRDYLKDPDRIGWAIEELLDEWDSLP